MNANAPLSPSTEDAGNRITTAASGSDPIKSTGPSRLSLWLDKLPGYQLPLNPTLAEAIRVEMREEECTSEHLAVLVRQDPSLVLRVYQSARRRMQSKDGDIQGLIHLIGLVGLGFLEDTLKGAKKTPQAAKGQTACLAASLFAAQLAQVLLPLRHGTLGERFFLPALLYGAPVWMMWQAAPGVLGKIRQAAANQPQNINSLCKSKLGFPLAALLKHSKNFVQLPEITQQALSVDMSQDLSLWSRLLLMSNNGCKLWLEDNTREKHFFLSQATGIFLVNQYALALYLDTSGKHRDRFADLLGKHLGIDASELESLIQRAADNCQFPDTMGEESKPLKYLPKPQEALPQVPTSASPLQRLERATSLDEALTVGCEAMINVTGARRLLAFGRGQYTDDALKLFFQRGLEDPAATSLILKKDRCGGFFKKMQEKPVALRVSTDQLDKIEKQLPKPLLRYWQPGAFSILSVFYNDEVCAIIICDRASWGAADHARFKTVGKVLGKTLKGLASP